MEGTGLYAYGFRYYDPVVGRFTGVDPLAGEFAAWSGYNYVLNNPISLVDPDGRAPEDIIFLNADGSESLRLFAPGEDIYILPVVSVSASNGSAGESAFTAVASFEIGPGAASLTAMKVPNNSQTWERGRSIQMLSADVQKVGFEELGTSLTLSMGTTNFDGFVDDSYVSTLSSANTVSRTNSLSLGSGLAPELRVTNSSGSQPGGGVGNFYSTTYGGGFAGGIGVLKNIGNGSPFGSSLSTSETNLAGSISVQPPMNHTDSINTAFDIYKSSGRSSFGSYLDANGIDTTGLSPRQ